MSDWIFAKLEPVFGGELEKCLVGLGEEASLDLRVNALKKITREQVQILLEKFDIKAEKTNYSPLGLRIHSRRRIDQIKPFRDGLLEIKMKVPKLFRCWWMQSRYANRRLLQWGRRQDVSHGVVYGKQG